MKKVTIVGCGALGSHVAQFLRNDAELKVIDFDRVEQKNVLAQFHGKTAIGKNKAEALRQAMAFLFGTKLEAIPHKLVKNNVDALLKDADLIIDCLDNGEARRLVQDYTRGIVDDGGKIVRVGNIAGIPTYGTERVVITDAGSRPACLHGALAAGGDYGRAVWDEHFVIDEAGPGAPTCEGGEHLVFIALAAATIAYTAREFLRTGKKLNFTIAEGGAQRI